MINAGRAAHGPLWQQSFHDRIIRDERQLFATIEYVHLNPVVAGLAGDPETYEFSSAGRPSLVDLDEFYGTPPRLESLGYAVGGGSLSARKAGS